MKERQKERESQREISYIKTERAIRNRDSDTAHK